LRLFFCFGHVFYFTFFSSFRWLWLERLCRVGFLLYNLLLFSGAYPCAERGRFSWIPPFLHSTFFSLCSSIFHNFFFFLFFAIDFSNA